ncbi:hypothetical protein [Sphingobacterium mizutaii]|uniref:hypothetical protein n=1 Tax=Sphingobacterium mizutaii TaxID=1010 RepID=UPI003D983FC8
MIIRPSWPLGTRFIDSRRREFQVTKVTMGWPKDNIFYEVEMANGWKVISQPGEHPQTEVGFVDVSNRENLITESVEKLDQFVKNGHLKIIGYELSI